MQTTVFLCWKRKSSARWIQIVCIESFASRNIRVDFHIFLGRVFQLAHLFILQNMAKLFELRPKKDLLDSTFEGYKLSLDSLPVYKHEVPVAVEHLKPNDEQFSFQHVKTFGLHNHLIDDPWNEEIAFFISKDLQIFYINIHSLVCLNIFFDLFVTLFKDVCCF